MVIYERGTTSVAYNAVHGYFFYHVLVGVYPGIPGYILYSWLLYMNLLFLQMYNTPCFDELSAGYLSWLYIANQSLVICFLVFDIRPLREGYVWLSGRL